MKSHLYSCSIKSAFILGSTSEIARSICHKLAQNGCQRFYLIARNEKSNQSLVEELKRNYDVSVETERTDLLEDASVNKTQKRNIDDFDLYLITAGDLGNSDLARFNSNEALKIISSNISGLIPWITAITTEERISKKSRLWVFSSVAADKGRPSNYHYGAAKAALTTLCEGLLLRCHGKPFSVRIIKAGYIATRMTLGKAPKFLCISPNHVARVLMRRPNKRGIEYLPWWWSPLMLIIRFLPSSITSKL